MVSLQLVPQGCRLLQHMLNTYPCELLFPPLEGQARVPSPSQALLSDLILSPLIGTQTHIWSHFIENDSLLVTLCFMENQDGTEPESLLDPCLSARDSASPSWVPRTYITTEHFYPVKIKTWCCTTIHCWDQCIRRCTAQWRGMIVSKFL